MKKLTFTTALLVGLFAAQAQATQTCADKQAEIQRQLDYAHAHNNSRQAAGLETALANSKDSCTEAGLAQEKARDIEEKQQKVEERREALREAQSSGKADKIEKKQHKLDEALAELDKASLQ